jgi:hypothetical protein
MRPDPENHYAVRSVQLVLARFTVGTARDAEDV